jgi:regulator of CtrA degradation
VASVEVVSMSDGRGWRAGGIPGPDGDEPVSFGERFTRSNQFDRVFKEGMALVERTAEYLDREGRSESRKLKPPVSLTYSTESMRLTTRLLDLASWLLIQRGIKNGEISREEAAARRSRLKLGGTGRPTHIVHFDQLPTKLQHLIEESFQITDRIVQLDRAIEGTATDGGANPVGEQLAQIESAFRARPRLVASR